MEKYIWRKSLVKMKNLFFLPLSSPLLSLSLILTPTLFFLLSLYLFLSYASFPILSAPLIPLLLLLLLSLSFLSFRNLSLRNKSLTLEMEQQSEKSQIGR